MLYWWLAMTPENTRAAHEQIDAAHGSHNPIGIHMQISWWYKSRTESNLGCWCSQKTLPLTYLQLCS